LSRKRRRNAQIGKVLFCESKARQQCRAFYLVWICLLSGFVSYLDLSLVSGFVLSGFAARRHRACRWSEPRSMRWIMAVPAKLHQLALN
jgi:hypothetical protein